MLILKFRIRLKVFGVKSNICTYFDHHIVQGDIRTLEIALDTFTNNTLILENKIKIEDHIIYTPYFITKVQDLQDLNFLHKLQTAQEKYYLLNSRIIIGLYVNFYRSILLIHAILLDR